MIDFIGIGAQKAGTSWVYACLYEHPEIHAPIKEINFFSRERFNKGQAWYEAHFSHSKEGQKVGEFSTSYLYSKETPARIAKLYPDVKLIAILRNPIKRAYSQYNNSIRARHIPESVSFQEFKAKDESVLGQGLYTEQLNRYFQFFSKEQLLVLIYEDIEKDPATFIKKIYEHLEVTSDFSPTMLHNKINIARIPTWIGIERVMHKLAEFLRRIHLDKFVWTVRKSGLPDYIRGLNTKKPTSSQATDQRELDQETLKEFYKKDVADLSVLLGRDMNTEWNI